MTVEARTTSVSVSGVRYTYPGSGGGIRDVTLGISNGELIAVIGPNGGGKSTLLRLIAGILTPQSGTVAVANDGPDGAKPSRAQLVAYVGQSHDMVFPFPVFDVVLAGRTPHVSRFRFESERDRAVAFGALESVGIAHLANRRVTDLSGGERQLVAIARGLAQEPECILLDEPTASLDLPHRWRVVNLIQDLRSKRRLTTVLVTHDLTLLDGTFDRVAAMKDGRLVALGPTDTVVDASVLSHVYGEGGIRTARFEGRTFVWPQSKG